MEYFTLVCAPDSWRVYRGIGSDSPPIAERREPTWLVDFDTGRSPVVWVAGHAGRPEDGRVWRGGLFDLDVEQVPWERGRVGALACSPDARRALVLRVPDAIGEEAQLWCWNGGSWDRVESDPTPDVSTKLAWLEDESVVYESAGRQLVVLDMATGGADVGPTGSRPACARAAREWMAVSGGRVLRFAFDAPFAHPEVVTDFDVGEVGALRLSDDGRVCTWSEPHAPKRSTGYVQERGAKRGRFSAIDDGRAVGAAVGRYEGLS
jgi:hypothetical protein